MIPDSYWNLLRRWWPLMLTSSLLGAIVAYAALPPFLGPSTNYESETSLAVARYISSTRIVTAGEPDFDGDLIISDYTSSLADYAATTRFFDSVQERVREEGSSIRASAIEAGLTVNPNDTLFRLEIAATASSTEEAEAMAEAAAFALAEKAQADEDAAAGSLLLTLEQQRADLTERYLTLRTERDRALLGIGTRNTNVIEVEMIAVEDELAEKTRQREQLLLDRSAGGPLQPIGSAQTIESSTPGMATTDLMVLGLFAGAVAGWVAANVAERRRSGSAAPGTEVVVYTGPSRTDVRLQQLVSRAAALEQRARSLTDPDGPAT